MGKSFNLHFFVSSLNPAFLLISYPSHFIDTQFTRFFSNHLSFHSLLPMIENEKQYQLLHESVRHQSLTKTLQKTTNSDRNESDLSDSHQHIPITSNKTKQDRMIVHYIHESRFRSFNKGLHQIHQQIFKNTPALGTRLIVGNRNRRSSKFELIRKRPSRKLLTDKPRQGNVLIRSFDELKLT